MAVAARDAGAIVTLITGPSNEVIPLGVNAVKVTTAEQMLDAVNQALPVDIAIFAAAVADWKIADYSDKKIKKQVGDEIKTLSFVENPDILKTISNLKNNRPKLVVGFAAETDNVIDNAKAKIKRKGCDLMIVNDVSPKTGIMGGDHNKISLIKLNDEQIEHWDLASKTQIAKQIIEYIGRIKDE